MDITSDVSVENKTRENYSNIDQESAQKNEITKQTTVCTVSTHHRHQMNSHCDCLNDQLTPQIAQNSHSSDPVLCTFRTTINSQYIVYSHWFIYQSEKS